MSIEPTTPTTDAPPASAPAPAPQSQDAAAQPLPHAAAAPSAASTPAPSGPEAPRNSAGSYMVGALTIAALAALASSGLLWQKLSGIQEQLARQSADAGAQAIEARTMARQAEELVRDTAARLAVAEARVSEVALQRSQLEELMRSLSRSRDENLVVDIETAIRMAQQQAQLTGSLDPLIATLKSANQRIDRAAQPRLSPVQRAIARDLDRLTSATVTDTTGLLARLDELVRQIDDLPLQNAVAAPPSAARSAAAAKAPNAPAAGASAPAGDAEASWWQSALQNTWRVVADEARSLVRVRRIDHPDAILVSPDQTFFLRENLKLKLLNARLGLLARQLDSARADLDAASTSLNKYFDPSARRTQNALALLQQAQVHMKATEQPRLDETLSALATAAAGR